MTGGIHWRWGMGGLSRRSPEELGVTQGNGSGGAQGEVEICSQASCFPQSGLLELGGWNWEKTRVGEGSQEWRTCRIRWRWGKGWEEGAIGLLPS